MAKAHIETSLAKGLQEGSIEMSISRLSAAVTLKDEERAVYVEYETRLAKNYDEGLKLLRARGEIFRQAKADHPKTFVAWVEDANSRNEQDDTQGFDHSMRSIEYWMSLDWLYETDPKLYSLHRKRGAVFLWTLSAGLQDGQTLEVALEGAETEKKRRRKPSPELTGGEEGTEVPQSIAGDLYRSEYPALATWIDVGILAPREAERIVTFANRALTQAQHPLTIEIIQKIGVRDEGAAGALKDVEDALAERRRMNKERSTADQLPVLDVLELMLRRKADKDYTGGYFELASGDMVILLDCSGREIWGAYASKNKEAAMAKDAAETILDRPVSRETLSSLITQYGDSTSKGKVEDAAFTGFKLMVKGTHIEGGYKIKVAEPTKKKE